MKRIIINSVYLIFLICSSVFSQARMQKIMLQGDDVCISRELETVIVGKDGVVTGRYLNAPGNAVTGIPVYRYKRRGHHPLF